MRKLSHEIGFTLIVKLVLLTILWGVCIRGAVKNTVSMQQWLYGSSTEVAGKKHNIN